MTNNIVQCSESAIMRRVMQEEIKYFKIAIKNL